MDASRSLQQTGDHNFSQFSEFASLLGARHITTTAYHSCANGLVEHFHHQLKIVLTASTDNQFGLDGLLLVMLALRNVVKEDLKCTTVKLVSGSPLVLPGQIVEDNISTMPSTQFIQDLKNCMSTLGYMPSCMAKKPVFIPKNLNNCDYIFLSRDAVKKPLMLTHSGLYRVVSHAPKYFIILINNKQVTIDRIKPAFLDNMNNSSAVQDQMLPSQTNNEPATITTRTPKWTDMFIGLLSLKFITHIESFSYSSPSFNLGRVF